MPALAQAAEPGKPFRVVTTFTVIQDIAQNVAGDKAIVESITKPGAEIHDYQPTPLDIVKAQDADLVLWNGFNLERWFEKFFENVKDVPSAVVSEGIEPMGIAGRWAKIKAYFQGFPIYRHATFKRTKSYMTSERMR